MALGLEALEQIAAMDWFRLQYPYLTHLMMHIPNERKCSKWYGSILRKMGVISGASDLFFAYPRGTYHGMFLEVKTLKGKLTPNQQRFLEDMHAQRYFATCEKGLEAIIARIKWYIELPTFKDN